MAAAVAAAGGEAPSVAAGGLRLPPRADSRMLQLPQDPREPLYTHLIKDMWEAQQDELMQAQVAQYENDYPPARVALEKRIRHDFATYVALPLTEGLWRLQGSKQGPYVYGTEKHVMEAIQRAERDQMQARRDLAILQRADKADKASTWLALLEERWVEYFHYVLGPHGERLVKVDFNSFALAPETTAQRDDRHAAAQALSYCYQEFQKHLRPLGEVPLRTPSDSELLKLLKQARRKALRMASAAAAAEQGDGSDDDEVQILAFKPGRRHQEAAAAKDGYDEDVEQVTDMIRAMTQFERLALPELPALPAWLEALEEHRARLAQQVRDLWTHYEAALTAHCAGPRLPVHPSLAELALEADGYSLLAPQEPVQSQARQRARVRYGFDVHARARVLRWLVVQAEHDLAREGAPTHPRLLELRQLAAAATEVAETVKRSRVTFAYAGYDPRRRPHQVAWLHLEHAWADFFKDLTTKPPPPGSTAVDQRALAAIEVSRACAEMESTLPVRWLDSEHDPVRVRVQQYVAQHAADYDRVRLSLEETAEDMFQQVRAEDELKQERNELLDPEDFWEEHHALFVQEALALLQARRARRQQESAVAQASATLAQLLVQGGANMGFVRTHAPVPLPRPMDDDGSRPAKGSKRRRPVAAVAAAREAAQRTAQYMHATAQRAAAVADRTAEAPRSAAAAGLAPAVKPRRPMTAEQRARKNENDARRRAVKKALREAAKAAAGRGDSSVNLAAVANAMDVEEPPAPQADTGDQPDAVYVQMLQRALEQQMRAPVFLPAEPEEDEEA